MKHTSNVTTVMAVLAEATSKHGFWYPITFFYALTIGAKYKVDLTNHEFVQRLYDFLKTWDEDKDGRAD